MKAPRTGQPNSPLMVTCPRCKRRRGYRCKKPNGKTYDSFHMERVDEAAFRPKRAHHRSKRLKKRGVVVLGRLEITIWN